MAKKHTRPTTSTKTFEKLLKQGRLPHTQAAQALKSFFGKRGKPLAHQLRSEKKRKEFNRLVKEFNRQRVTKEKEQTKRDAIREKQLATVRRNVLPEAADKAAAEYNKMIDVLQTVHDTLMINIKYEEYMAMANADPGLSAEKMSDFITKTYNSMRESLPSFAMKGEALGETFTRELENIMNMFGGENIGMGMLSEALAAKAAGPAEFNKILRRYKKNPKRTARAAENRYRRGQRV